MTNQFIVNVREISLLDEQAFLARGGEELHFGALDDDDVLLTASGSPEAICRLARSIISHHTASR